MKRIAILTCSNCTQEVHCASTGCLEDMRHRNGYFQRYSKDKTIELVGIISCAGCPTIAASEKILKRVAAVAEYNIDVLHFSYCATHLCPFISKYKKIIKERYPNIEIVLGTHPESKEGVKHFRQAVKEMLAPTIHPPQDMNDYIKDTFKMPVDRSGIQT